MSLRRCSRMIVHRHSPVMPAVVLGFLDIRHGMPAAHEPAGPRQYFSNSDDASGTSIRGGSPPADYEPDLQDALAPHEMPHSAESLTKQEDAYRRGFGAKVALPAKDVLQEVLAIHPATFKLRAYHIGKCIHIGQVLKQAKAMRCRTNSGKDYCMIWLGAAWPNSPSSMPSSQHSSKVQHQHSKNQLSPAAAWSQLWQKITSASEGPLRPAAILHRRDGASRIEWRKPELGIAKDVPFKLRQATESEVPCMMVVYRYGSVVFAGTRVWEEPWFIQQYIPEHVRYIAGGHGNTWTMRDLGTRPWLLQEEQTVVVKPDALQPAVKGVDTVELRVLDVGSVRVLTSVLGQSVALKLYEMSVGDALDKLAQWRARTRRAASYQQSGGLGFFTGSQEQTRLFKVIAASALIINEARELLEMAEPAWQYETYHSIWSLAADDFELEKRFRALEIKLHQVEKEAKHDVKQREGRKYHKLEQSVVLLLMVSCILAVLHLSKKLMNKSSSSSNFSGMDAAAAGLSVDEGTVTEAEIDAVQQLQLQREQAAAVSAAVAEDSVTENQNMPAAAAAECVCDEKQLLSISRASSEADDRDSAAYCSSFEGAMQHAGTQTDTGTSSIRVTSDPGRRRWWIWAKSGT